MKPRKSIKVPLPPLTMGTLNVNNTPGFLKFVEEAATRLLRETCHERWMRHQYAKFLMEDERKRRKNFQFHLSMIKGGKANPASPQLSSARTHDAGNSKKAPVATSRNEGE